MTNRIGLAMLALALIVVCAPVSSALSAPAEAPAAAAIERILAPGEDVLEVLGPTYRRILDSVLPTYNLGRSVKRERVEIAGGVVLGDDLDDPTSDFTLTVEQDAQGVQTMEIRLDALGAAELTLDPEAGEVVFRLTYEDGRRAISGRGLLAPSS